MPIVYSLSSNAEQQVTIHSEDGQKHVLKTNELNDEFSQMLFTRSGKIVRIDVSINRNKLYEES